MERTSFLWLEITGRCQLTCVHCYADSGPLGRHGTMKREDWIRVLSEARELGMHMVQFIGGEPTLHPDLPVLINHALTQGLTVEVFSNLVHITEKLWNIFSQPGVSLATSYYSDNADQHAAVTGRQTYMQTKTNIMEALRRSIPLRTGLIDVQDGQRVEQARAELEALGVVEIGSDQLRQVGRGVRNHKPDISQLCGKCAQGVAAVSSNGDVWPCVFARWMPVGNVHHHTLSEVLNGPEMVKIAAQLSTHFKSRSQVACNPDDPNCRPNCDPYCNPNCKPSCDPHCQPTCPPRCSPTCDPRNCKPRSCWPDF